MYGISKSKEDERETWGRDDRGGRETETRKKNWTEQEMQVTIYARAGVSIGKQVFNQSKTKHRSAQSG